MKPDLKPEGLGTKTNRSKALRNRDNSNLRISSRWSATDQNDHKSDLMNQ